jgi:hypothetical protein
MVNKHCESHHFSGFLHITWFIYEAIAPYFIGWCLWIAWVALLATIQTYLLVMA